MSDQQKYVGYFYTYRGNGYGPFEAKYLAEENAIAKGRDNVFIWYGAIIVKNGKLIDENLNLIERPYY